MSPISRRDALVMGSLASILGVARCGTESASVTPATALASDLVAGPLEGVFVVPKPTGDPKVDTANVQGTFAATQANTRSGVCGAHVVFPAGEWVVDDTITLYKFSGVISGQGVGNSPDYEETPGHASVIRWAGTSDKPMFLLRDYDRVTFENLRLEGNDSSPPKYAIESRWLKDDQHGTAANLVVSDCVLGTYPWSTQGARAGRIKAGIGFTGDNGNNDEFMISKTSIFGCEVGVDIPNTQSIWGLIDSLLVSSASVAGIRSSSSFTAVNLTFDACSVDVILSSTARPSIHGWWSERSACIFDQDQESGFSVRGGLWLIGDAMGGKPALNQDRRISSDITIEDVQVIYQQDAKPPLSIKGASAENPYYVTLSSCRGLGPETLDVRGPSEPGTMFVELATGGVQLSTTVRDRPLAEYLAPTRVVESASLADGESEPLICDGESIVITLPRPEDCRPGATSFTVKNINASAATLRPSGGRVDGSDSLVLQQWQSASVFTDGRDWFTRT